MADIEVRHCHGIAEYEECVKLQKQVWGYDERDIIPSRVFIVAKKIGGQVIGSFDGERLVGFAYSMPGFRNGHSYLHSHMLAVAPEYRNFGLGRRMKLAQRKDAISRGIDLLEWTFDPLEIKNAHLNINRLGAIVRRYVPNQYGESTSPLQGGLPTDRLIAEWWVKSRRVEQLLDGGGFSTYRIDERVTVPAAIGAWKQSGDKRAKAEQTMIREQLSLLLRQGLAILRYTVLDDGSGEFGLGVWDEEWTYGAAPDEDATHQEFSTTVFREHQGL